MTAGFSFCGWEDVWHTPEAPANISVFVPKKLITGALKFLKIRIMIWIRVSDPYHKVFVPKKLQYPPCVLHFPSLLRFLSTFLFAV